MKEVLRVLTKSEGETKKFAKLLAQELLKFNPPARPSGLRLRGSDLRSRRAGGQEALVVGLTGELGAGKTIFAKGFAQGLGIKSEMTSPTFILMRVFRIPRTKKHFFHFDAYRIAKAQEFLDLGFKELLKNPSNILLIEWSERVKKILPKNYFKLSFWVFGKNSRQLTLSF